MSEKRNEFEQIKEGIIHFLGELKGMMNQISEKAPNSNSFSNDKELMIIS
jgi:hypothetical protein